jgi:hypothetical protein
MRGLRGAVSIFLLVGVLAVASPAQAVPIQWSSGSGANNHWYEVITSAVNWAAATTGATSLGGYLATITSADENAFVANLVAAASSVNNTNGAWLGGHNPSGGFVWSGGPESGNAFTYTNWSSGDPNGGANSAVVICSGIASVTPTGTGSCTPPPTGVTTLGQWIDRDKTDQPGSPAGTADRWYYAVEWTTTPPGVTTAAPEPATLVMFGTGMLGLAARYRKRRK